MSAIPIHISQHALWRAYDRFPGFDLAQIVPEIREAFRTGSVSAARPPGVISNESPDHFYASCAEGHRVYVLCAHADGTSIAVVTVLKTTLAPDWKPEPHEPTEVVLKPPCTPDYWGKRS